jgi:hypothetical protein
MSTSAYTHLNIYRYMSMYKCIYIHIHMIYDIYIQFCVCLYKYVYICIVLHMQMVACIQICIFINECIFALNTSLYLLQHLISKLLFLCRDTYLTAEDAQKFGLIDEVIATRYVYILIFVCTRICIFMFV